MRESAAAQSSMDDSQQSGTSSSSQYVGGAEGSNKRLKREDSMLDFSAEAWSIYSVGEGQWPLSAWGEGSFTNAYNFT